MTDGDDVPDGNDGPEDAAAASDPTRRKRRRRRRRDGEPPADAQAARPSDPASADPSPADPTAAVRASDKPAPGPRAPEQRREPRPPRKQERREPNRSGGDRIKASPPAEKQPGGDRTKAPQSGGDRIKAPRAPDKQLETFAQARQPGHDDPDEAPSEPAALWGRDDDEPAPAVVLAPDFPSEPGPTEQDPVTEHLDHEPLIALGDDVASVVGVRLVQAGRIQWFDAGDHDFAQGDRVMVDADRGARLAWIAIAPTRKPVRERGLRRVIRRANEQDLRGENDGDAERIRFLRIAKDAAAKVVDRELRPLMKVYRVDVQGSGRGGKLYVYYTSDERLDLREFLRDLGNATSARIELRQLGVRDEAKAVGGIGSCGLTLCCTTWLPDFVPVSIKMAKDQGLVLSPTKVSGQCGRLKCCLVYEQAGYAEMRKGLPKLGKRVVSARGEGRVVEVDVLRQRIRVSYGPGETEMHPAADVKPLFPSGNQPNPKASDDEDHDAGDEPSDA